MSITVKKGSVSTSTYSVRGGTLAEVDAHIKKAGPKDPNDGKRYSGNCLCSAKLDAKTSKVEYEVSESGEKHSAVARMARGILTYTCTITKPKLGGELSQDAEKEWKRFLGAVDAHENGHVLEYGKELEAVAKEIDGLSAEGEGQSEREARQAAFRAFAVEFTKIDLKQRLNANAAAYDQKHGHGESQGAVLDTSIG